MSRRSGVAAWKLRPDLSLERALGLIFLGLGGLAAAIVYFPARAWIVHRELGGLLLDTLSLATLLLASGLWLWSYGRREASRPLPAPIRISATCILLLALVLRRSLRGPDSRWSAGRS